MKNSATCPDLSENGQFVEIQTPNLWCQVGSVQVANVDPNAWDYYRTKQ
jgi:hypothetical protein